MNKNLLDVIEIQNAIRLLTLLSKADLLDPYPIQLAYEQDGANFNETADFLMHLNLISPEGPGFAVSEEVSELSDSVEFEGLLKQMILSRLLLTSHPWREMLLEFLGNFSLVDSVFTFRPSGQIGLLYSGIRNILIATNFLDYQENQRRYIVRQDQVEIFRRYFGGKKKSPKELQNELKKQADIGRRAEERVLAYEQARLRRYPDLMKRISHIALENTLAGYDISSFEAYESGETPRFIEVKAVSVTDYKFYWSRNEMQEAERLGKQYWLYLLPVSGNGTFDLARMLLVSDPIKALSTSRHWHTNVESISVCRSEES